MDFFYFCRVILDVKERAAFGAFEVEVVALFKVKAHTVICADVELAVFFSGKPFGELFELAFFDFFDEVFDAFLVERPVVDVPSFFLVFFAAE